MTNVPAITFGPLGFQAPSGPAVLAGVIADINAAFGVTLNYQLTTPQGQLASSQSAIIVNVNAMFSYYTNQVDPAYATGRMQDAIARIYFITRFPAEPTVLQISCSGLNGVVIPLTATVADAGGNIYQCTASGTIPDTGNVTLPFAAVKSGPTAVPEEVSIYQATPGWDSATVVSGVVGQNTETRAQFEARRKASVAKNSVGMLASVQGAVLAVPGVLDAYVTENNESSPVTKNGYTLAGNSLYVAVVGGDADDIAKAIWSKKAPGCVYSGNTVVTVYDETGYSPPYPAYDVRFEIPSSLSILFAVTIANSPQVPANAADLIKQVILDAFGGVDGGPRARIGSTIYASRYVTPIAALGAWAQIVSLTIGSDNAPAAIFTGSIAGGVLTASIISSGVLATGQTISDAADLIPNGTRVTGQLTGFPGQAGTYSIAPAQTVTSRQLKASAATGQSVVVEIDQSPTLSADNILVTVS